jgi:hypothetical protein
MRTTTTTDLTRTMAGQTLRSRSAIRPGRAAARVLAFTLALVLLAPGARAADARKAPQEKVPQPLELITAAPADPGLKRVFLVNQGGDSEREEGAELPSSIMYSLDDKDFGTFMAVTDQRLCKRPSEKEICKAFVGLIAGPPPQLGKEVTGTRIGGSGYGTVYLKQISGINYLGVDRFTAFLGADSQDPPLSGLNLYIYAQKGTNLIQISVSVGKCAKPVKRGEKDEAYYRRSCVSDVILEKAMAAGKMAAERFRLAGASAGN